jgi:UDP-N-acetylglucosamine--N-acetylmuramyl-(pentapeptide) pyrophosphoryl-undecaprenol N-acetylglucosamine transferase
MAAWLLRVPLFLQEQNSVPGRSNRILARGAVRVFAGFSGAVPFFPPGRTEVTGNPVRAEIVAAAAAARDSFPTDAAFTVLALGGSQGARAINTRVLGMARRAKREGRAMRFLLQAGSREYDAVAEAVRAEDLPVEAFPFTDRIGEVFPRCHVVLMRAGALSITEAALFGRPCVLIPYPYAADGHQARNAEEYCAAGAGRWMPEGDASEEAVWDALWALGGDREARVTAGAAAQSFSRPGAAFDAVREALRLAGRKTDV